MPNKELVSVRKPPRVDARTMRSTHALAHALIQLIQDSEGQFEDITVREILERAGVSRTTFYSHFRSKEDVLHSVYESMFALYKSVLQQEINGRVRLFPVSEFVEHVSISRPVMVAFRKAGLADDMRSQFVGYAADIIECRMRDLHLSTTVQPRLAARMLAAALIESIDWWFDHESVAATEIDTAFHLLARTLITSNGVSARR
jgi:AcrR family transcriptional regulator